MTILDDKTELDDATTRPSYYGGPDNPFEPVKVIHDAGLGPGFYFGSALKYLQRAPFKGQQESDLKKAEWYLTNGIELGYEMPRFAGELVGRMKPAEVVKGWGLPEGLDDVGYNILAGNLRAAAMGLRAYIVYTQKQQQQEE